MEAGMRPAGERRKFSYRWPVVEQCVTSILADGVRHQITAHKKAAVSSGELRLLELPGSSEEIFLVVIGGLEPPTPAL